MSLKTSYEFTLPRGFVDNIGRVHAKGTMRLATARDELDPLRDPTVRGPEDPRLTILVLSRVVETLGELEMVNAHHIENLFAVDLAYLQDFYGVINFGSQAEYDALLRSQRETILVGMGHDAPDDGGANPDVVPDAVDDDSAEARPQVRAAVEEIRRQAQ